MDHALAERLLVERIGHAVACRQVVLSVEGPAEAENNGGDENIGDGAHGHPCPEQGGGEPWKFGEMRHDGEDRRNDRHQIASTASQRPAGGADDRDIERRETHPGKMCVRQRQRRDAEEDREPGALTRQGMKAIGEAADRQMTIHACPTRSKGSPSSFPPQVFLCSRRHAPFRRRAGH